MFLGVIEIEDWLEKNRLITIIDTVKILGLGNVDKMSQLVSTNFVPSFPIYFYGLGVAFKW